MASAHIDKLTINLWFAEAHAVGPWAISALVIIIIIIVMVALNGRK